MRTILSVFFTMAAALASAGSASACTTFNLNGGEVNIFGRNYDWPVAGGVVIQNQRGLGKTAMTAKDEAGQRAKWKSKYGSITFNQYGREFPQGGMNEAGLVVEVMAVLEGEYPAPDTRPYVGKSQYRQYLLDSFSSVKEVIESDSVVRVSPTGKGPMIHLLISDRSGNCAVIEFIKGNRVVYTGSSLPVRALSNTPYVQSLGYWKAGKGPAEDKLMSVQRFMRAADSASSFDGTKVKAPVDHAFGILKNTVQENRTQWSIVYDLNNLQIFYRTAGNQKTRQIELKDANFSCNGATKMIDINAGAGSVNAGFQPYTLQANRKVIAESFAQTDFLKNLPGGVIDAIASYPESARCEELQ